MSASKPLVWGDEPADAVLSDGETCAICSRSSVGGAPVCPACQAGYPTLIREVA